MGPKDNSASQPPFGRAPRAGRLAAAVAVAVMGAACAGAPSAPAPVRPVVGHYPAAFPTVDLSEALSGAFEAVKQIQVSVVYEVHTFSQADAPTRGELEREDVTHRAVATDTVREVRRATAVLLSRSPDHVLLLTAAHAVHRPETVIDYFGPETDAPDPERRIRNLSIKTRQTSWVLDLPGARTFELLAMDSEQDVAVIGFQLVEPRELVRSRPMPVRPGDPDDLVPGSFVYVLGYPGGYRMVSRGIATPLDGPEDEFVVDGNWNQGVSGGAILAVRADGETLEWVGMARAASATREQRLVAPEALAEAHDPGLPYEGPLFLEEMLRIQYGVTLSVSMTTIRRFLDRHREELTRLGYAVPR